MEAFVDVMLRRSAQIKEDADVEALLGYLADHLGYRSGFLLEFPTDPGVPVRLWDSNAARSRWWRDYTANGATSLSQSFAKLLDGGVQQLEIPPVDPRFAVANAHDFADTTVVPITFASHTRGVASFSGSVAELEKIALSLEVVCYALLMQVRTLRFPSTLSATSLTAREREVVSLAADGLTSEMIASRLGMSPRTASQHLDNVAIKLRTKNRVHTVAEALRRRLLD